jgi:hypothetical protein
MSARTNSFLLLTQTKLNEMDGENVSSLYKGIKSEYLPNVNLSTIKYNDNEYHLIKYKKDKINNDNVLTTGQFRSVIARNGKVLSFAPPKSMETSHFIETYKDIANCYAEEFVEGTMINLFYDDADAFKHNDIYYDNYDEKNWVITTKSNIGATNSFFTNGHVEVEDTFRYMFIDACKHANLDYKSLPRQYQYSFVLQHPKNRIVLDIKEPTLYLIDVNCIRRDDNLVTRMSLFNELDKTKVKHPTKYEFGDLSEFVKEWKNTVHDYTTMGVVIYCKYGYGHRNRTKLRNPAYEYVKVLRGNQPKLEYRFIELWQEKRVQEYLSYFPECKTLFDTYWSKLSKFMDATFNNYVACYMLKRQALKEYPFEYRNHMYALHTMYKEQLRSKNSVVTIPITVEYFRALPAAKLMFSLNYNMRPTVDNVSV